LSANKTGISVYILDIKDRKYLAQTFRIKIGKASVSGYCIKFKTLSEINIDVLESAIRYGVKAEN
jgi:nucleoside-triphosphatase THEP1